MATDTVSFLPEMRAVPLAWRNLVSSKLRLVRSIAGIGFAVLLMLVQLGFERGFFDASLGILREIDGDLFIMRASKYRFGSEDPFPAANLTPTRAIAGVASVAPLYAAWQHFLWKEPNGEKTYLVQAFGFDPDHPVFLLPELRQQSDRLHELDTVIVDRRSRPFLGMDDGTSGTEINDRPIADRRQLFARPRFHGQRHGNDERADLRGVAGRQRGSSAGHSGRVRGRQIAAGRRSRDGATGAGSRVTEGIADIEQARAGGVRACFPGRSVFRRADFLDGDGCRVYRRHVDFVSDHLHRSLRSAAAICNIEGHGYGSFYLVRVVFQQAAFAAVAAYVPAWLLCLLVYRVIGDLALMPLRMTLHVTAISFALTLVMCLISAALAIRRVIAVDPAEVF